MYGYMFRFMEIGGFPGIIGCIDCTQIAIIAPKADDPEMPGVIFYCRKQFYSLNVQIVSKHVFQSTILFVGS